jgi:hypothetical protein
MWERTGRVQGFCLVVVSFGETEAYCATQSALHLCVLCAQDIRVPVGMGGGKVRLVAEWRKCGHLFYVIIKKIISIKLGWIRGEHEIRNDECHYRYVNPSTGSVRSGRGAPTDNVRRHAELIRCNTHGNQVPIHVFDKRTHRQIDV